MSLRKAIDAKCRDCTYDPLAGLGTWRQQVDACPSNDCSLWPVRPRAYAPLAAGRIRAKRPDSSVQDPGTGGCQA